MRLDDRLEMVEIGRRIRHYRKVAGLTQEELAQKVEMSTMSIRRYESGERVASRPTIRVIAAALEVAPHLLMRQGQVTAAQRERAEDRARIIAAIDQMNEVGMGKVADYAEDILPANRDMPPQDAAEYPSAVSEGTDTPAAEKPPESTENGE